MWNLLDKLKKKIKGTEASETPDLSAEKALAADAAAAKEAAKAGGLPDGAPMAELEKKGLLGKFFRHWKDPALLQQMKAIVSRMQAEGVNVKDMSAVQAWIKAHQKEIESGQFSAAPDEGAKPQTFVKTGPEIGRNDPCSCGSGKKFKKCCGAKA